MLPELLHLSRQAAAAIMEHYATGPGIAVTEKDDRSPVTAADHAAHAVIEAGLLAAFPEIPIVSEEGTARVAGGRFWLVDPLDGTRSFIRRRGQFTVNIGLIEDGLPVAGVIVLPVEDTAYWGRVGEEAWRQTGPHGAVEQIHVRPPAADGLDAVVSLNHLDPRTEEFLRGYTVRQRVSASSSAKFCAVAEGAADIYPRFGPTMEWDTAAGHAILRTAGGDVTTPEGAPFTYGKADFRNGPFIGWGGLRPAV